MFCKLSLFAVVISAALVTPLRADRAPLSPEKLRETATHVITGKVTAVYQRTETTGDWKYTSYVAEVRVEDCEKGDGVKKGDLVYARYLQKEWVGKGQQPSSHSGHRGLPSDGESFRLYLARNSSDAFGENKDGGFNVIGPNGFQKLKPGPGK
jgi:hypothetical protein